MDLTAIIKLLKDNPEMLEMVLPVIKEVLISGINRLVDGILAKV